MKRSPAVAAGQVICTLLGVLDIAGMAALGTANAPPAPVLLAGGALGIITVAAVVPACRGHRGSENGRLVLSLGRRHRARPRHRRHPQADAQRRGRHRSGHLPGARRLTRRLIGGIP